MPISTRKSPRLASRRSRTSSVDDEEPKSPAPAPAATGHGRSDSMDTTATVKTTATDIDAVGAVSTASDLFRWITDPTAIFFFVVLVIPPTKEASFVAASVEYFLEPMFLLCLALALAVIQWSGGFETTSMSNGDFRLANWYLINGFYFHIALDFGVGVLHRWPLMDKNYKMLDKRFREDAGPDGGIAFVNGCVEAFMMAPLCFLCYRAIRQERPERYVLEAITGALHLFGTLNFVVADAWNNFDAQVYFDRKLEFTRDHLTYFWFGFFINIFWVAIPLYRMYTAYAHAAASTTERKQA